jgi:hypothetical protein
MSTFANGESQVDESQDNVAGKQLTKAHLLAILVNSGSVLASLEKFCEVQEFGAQKTYRLNKDKVLQFLNHKQQVLEAKLTKDIEMNSHLPAKNKVLLPSIDVLA